MFNIDRWGFYTRQNLFIRAGMHGIEMHHYHGSWAKLTPAQSRRVRKKANKGDTSIGILW